MLSVLLFYFALCCSNFLPSTGTLRHLSPPEERNGIRVDTGVVAGDEVSIFYDPMISKLIAHGEDRPAALRRLTEALKEYEVVGLSNNIEFLRKCASHPDFVEGGVTTNFLNVSVQRMLLGVIG